MRWSTHVGHSLARREAVDCEFAPPLKEVGSVVLVGVWWNVIGSGYSGVICGLPVVGQNFLDEYIKCTILALVSTPLQRT